MSNREPTLPIHKAASTKYFGVITEREYIKMRGERVPFWHFLDRLPDGWLTSLAYKRKNVPTDRLQMWDCGAWTYREEPQPKLGNNPVTPSWALEQYAMRAVSGAFVIAPDHILIDGVDLEARRQFNATSAREFLPIARAAGFRPMAAIHGMDGAERLQHVRRLLDLGYDALAVGGVAARASQQRLVLDMIQALREETPGVWLHILGLSAPSYMKAWNRIGVDSCDGSSHFKQAFTGGAFYVHEAGRLVRHQAARVNRETRELLSEPPAYECSCKACQMLRAEGIDTRTYGSNEHNMGRAAHNLNMLIQAHQYIAMQTTFLVSCVSIKGESAVPAAELYQSEWFKKARAYVEEQKAPWHILSAQHGVLDPEGEVSPYEETLNGMDMMERTRWAKEVAQELLRRYPEPTRFVILAGRAYREHLQPLLEATGHTCEVPMEGLGIGQQLAWLREKVVKQLPLFEVPTE